MGMLIAGRSIQGIGGGGINMLIELIVCDMVPLRERGNFIGLLFGFITIGAALGPFVGGIIVQTTTWRWVFYLNLPIGGAALIALFLFLHVGYKKETTVMQRLKRVDWLGNAVFVTAVTAILLALTWGGTIYAWSSFRIVLPLVLGFVGLAIFLLFESSKFCREPTMPPQLYKNRTSVTAFGLTFIHAMLTYWVLYFLPVYFQSVLLSTPARSGVQLLPTILGIIPFAIVSGLLLTKFGRYRPLHHIGFALITLALAFSPCLVQIHRPPYGCFSRSLAPPVLDSSQASCCQQLKSVFPKLILLQPQEPGLLSVALEQFGVRLFRLLCSTIDAAALPAALMIPM